MSKSEMTKNSLSVTFRVDNGIVEHNNRDFVAKNVVRERIADNVIYKQENIGEKYHELFDEALEEYNKNKRRERKISDYYEHMKKSQKEKPFYEIVVQFGDMDNCGFGKENFEEAKKMLDEYMKSFEKRNPNIKVFNAVMHLDEATPHIHIDFIPIAHKVEKGLSVKVSLKGALKEQGFVSNSKRKSEWALWADAEKKEMIKIMRVHGFSREDKKAHYAHMECDEFRETKKQITKMNEHINALKKKPVTEITAEEAALIKNQNDYMRGEILKRDEKIRILSQKAGAKFTQFEVYSPEKLAYISEELQRSNIPFVEESNSLYVPDWAFKNCCAIAAKFKASPKSSGVHDEIKLDIDTLIYSCENFEQLLGKLREQGYEIKEGKYLAVKSPKAQRFVRLKTLGEEYLPQNIEKRISERDKFPKAVAKKSANSNEIEQKFYSVITETVIAVRSQKYRPKKTNSKKIYCFENDAEINLLSQQLLTMHEMNITSRDGIYSAAEKSQQKISDTLEKIKKLSDEIPTLKSDIAQIKYWFYARQKSAVDAMERAKISTAKDTAEKYGIQNIEQIESLETRLRLIPTYIRTLKDELSDEQTNLSKLSELVRTYERVIEGNYIDNLIKAEKEKSEHKQEQQEKQKNVFPKK